MGEGSALVPLGETGAKAVIRTVPGLFREKQGVQSGRVRGLVAGRTISRKDNKGAGMYGLCKQ